MCCGNSDGGKHLPVNAEGCHGEWVRRAVVATNEIGMLVIGGNYYGVFAIGATVCVRVRDADSPKVTAA